MRDDRPRALPQHRRDARGAPGFDPARELVPVAPAAHYTMGGVATDLDGRGVAAGAATRSASARCTGLHGANRLASNSLAECFVFGRRAALAALRRAAGAGRRPARRRAAARSPVRRDETRAALWRCAGHRARRPTGSSGSRGPVPARTPDRALRARARGEPRRPPARRTSRPPTERSTGGTRCRRTRRRVAALGLGSPLEAGSSATTSVNAPLIIASFGLYGAVEYSPWSRGLVTRHG